MTDERTRIALHGKLEEVLGPVHTDALMAHLPPGGPATRDDLVLLRADFELFRSEMRGEFELFRSEMRGEFELFRTEMRGDFEVFRDEMRGEVEVFRGEMRGEVVALEDRLRAHMAESFAAHTRTIVLTVVFALVGSMLTTASLFLVLA
jgi:hypothetical protein